MVQAERGQARYKRRPHTSGFANQAGPGSYPEKQFPVGNPGSGYYMYNDTDDMTVGAPGNYQFQQYPASDAYRG